MRQSLWFTAARQLALRRSAIPEPAEDQVLIATEHSAISAGTERMIYRGEAPTELAADETIAALSGGLAFPLQYGYAAVGRVVATGGRVEKTWMGRRVFAFNPHETHFCATVDDVIVLPDELDAALATLLPNVETALSFVLDGQPLIGERVLVLGQGVVGLLTTLLLAHMPLAELATVDGIALRREKSAEFGATLTLSPHDPIAPSSYDLIYELSGNPAALNSAIEAAGYGGRIVVGSWYGNKNATLALGGSFHRKRIQLVSSQVSTLAPSLRGRWTKARRMTLALELLAKHAPDSLLTTRVPFAEAAVAYDLLDGYSAETLQIILDYNRHYRE